MKIDKLTRVSASPKIVAPGQRVVIAATASQSMADIQVISLCYASSLLHFDYSTSKFDESFL